MQYLVLTFFSRGVPQLEDVAGAKVLFRYLLWCLLYIYNGDDICNCRLHFEK